MNIYLEKLAQLGSIGKQYARSIAKQVSGDSSKINQVYGATSGILSKRMAGVMSSAEKKQVTDKVVAHANKTMGTGSLYSGQALRAARAGSRLARMQARQAA